MKDLVQISVYSRVAIGSMSFLIEYPSVSLRIIWKLQTSSLSSWWELLLSSCSYEKKFFRINNWERFVLIAKVYKISGASCTCTPWHDFSSLSAPEQSFPPNNGCGLVQVFVLNFFPVTLSHEDHSPQSLQPPSTKIDFYIMWRKQ